MPCRVGDIPKSWLIAGSNIPIVLATKKPDELQATNVPKTTHLYGLASGISFIGFRISWRDKRTPQEFIRTLLANSRDLRDFSLSTVIFGNFPRTNFIQPNTLRVG